MEYIITFDSTNHAILAESILCEQNIKVKVAPLASQIKAGCGITLRLSPDDLEQAMQVLKDSNISINFYSRKIQDGKYSYQRHEVQT